MSCSTGTDRGARSGAAEGPGTASPPDVGRPPPAVHPRGPPAEGGRRYAITDAVTDAHLAAIGEAAASHANITMTAKYDARNPVALKQLVGSGTKLRPFPQDVMNAAFKSAQEIYANYDIADAVMEAVA